MSVRYAPAVRHTEMTRPVASDSFSGRGRSCCRGRMLVGRPPIAKLLAAGLLVCFVFSVGCHRNIEPFVAGEEPRMPDLAEIFPAPEPEPPAGAASARAPGEPSSLPAAPQRGNVAAAPGIRGTIAISPSLVDQASPTGTLFVIARKSGTAGGPPLAVLRISEPRFPLAFEIGQEQVMIPGLRFEGEIQIAARLDSDGNAMTKLPGDLSGAAGGASAPGTDGVEIILDASL